MSSEAAAIAEQIKALSPPDQLRLAAELMERQKGDIAYSIIEHVKTELGAALALRRLGSF